MSFHAESERNGSESNHQVRHHRSRPRSESACPNEGSLLGELEPTQLTCCARGRLQPGMLASQSQGTHWRPFVHLLVAFRLAEANDVMLTLICALLSSQVSAGRLRFLRHHNILFAAWLLQTPNRLSPNPKICIHGM